MHTESQNTSDANQSERFFDGFTKTMLTIMMVLLLAIFASGKYMSAHKLAGNGTDDVVNDLASNVAKSAHHPVIDLPGDAELSAFSVANFFAGMIVGYHWLRLFGSKPAVKKQDGGQ